MNTKKNKKTSAVFIINLQKPKKTDRIANKKNNQPDIVICLAFSQHTHKNKGQLSNDN